VRTYRGLRALPGAFQADNLLVAVRLVEEARRAGLAVRLERVGAGVAATRWPGRLEDVPGRPRLLLDGAHNPAGARALAAEMEGRPRPRVLLFGAMADKAVEEMAGALFPRADAVVLTAPPMKRAARPAKLEARIGAAARGARVAKTPREALRLARRLAGPRGLVVVAGSLYLVGAVAGLLEKERARVSGRRA
jgi:dihydrofolate synthase/folylpolyglutamate synthase